MGSSPGAPVSATAVRYATMSSRRAISCFSAANCGSASMRLLTAARDGEAAWDSRDVSSCRNCACRAAKPRVLGSSAKTPCGRPSSSILVPASPAPPRLPPCSCDNHRTWSSLRLISASNTWIRGDAATRASTEALNGLSISNSAARSSRRSSARMPNKRWVSGSLSTASSSNRAGTS